jgi:hypothetical protein
LPGGSISWFRVILWDSTLNQIERKFFSRQMRHSALSRFLRVGIRAGYLVELSAVAATVLVCLLCWAFVSRLILRRAPCSICNVRYFGAKGATVDNPDTTYTHYSFILGDHISNIAIEGPGIIDGHRSVRGGPKLIALKNCRQVIISGLIMRNAPSYKY